MESKKIEFEENINLSMEFSNKNVENMSIKNSNSHFDNSDKILTKEMLDSQISNENLFQKENSINIKSQVNEEIDKNIQKHQSDINILDQDIDLSKKNKTVSVEKNVDNSQVKHTNALKSSGNSHAYLEFKEKTLYWGIYDDYPPWPCRIAPHHITESLKNHFKRDGVGVLFLEDELTYCLIECKNLFDFNVYYDNFKSRHVNDALKMIDKEIEFPKLELNSISDSEDNYTKQTIKKTPQSRKRVKTNAKKNQFNASTHNTDQKKNIVSKQSTNSQSSRKNSASQKKDSKKSSDAKQPTSIASTKSKQNKNNSKCLDPLKSTSQQQSVNFNQTKNEEANLTVNKDQESTKIINFSLIENKSEDIDKVVEKSQCDKNQNDFVQTTITVSNNHEEVNKNSVPDNINVQSDEQHKKTMIPQNVNQSSGPANDEKYNSLNSEIVELSCSEKQMSIDTNHSECFELEEKVIEEMILNFKKIYEEYPANSEKVEEVFQCLNFKKIKFTAQTKSLLKWWLYLLTYKTFSSDPLNVKKKSHVLLLSLLNEYDDKTRTKNGN